MPRVLSPTCAITALGAVVAGCQSAPVRYANDGVHATYSVASTGAHAMRTTGGELYLGAGNAVRRPLRDLNMMQDKIPPVLLRAESHPYDLHGVNSCNDVLDRVAELDLALGPDVDTPKEKRHTRVSRGADFAAEAALDAAGSAAEHFLPMRGTIKQITGAQRYENHVKHAQLAGTTRRSFLKAIGMEHSCVWPAAPLDFAPTQVADAAAPWAGPVTSAPQTGGAPVVLASASTTPAAASAVLSQRSSMMATAPAFVAEGAKPTAQLAAATRAPGAGRVVLVSAAGASSPLRSVWVPIRDRLAIPSAAPGGPIPDQAWRPASADADASALASRPALASTSVATGGGTAPWGAAFVGTAAGRP